MRFDSRLLAVPAIVATMTASALAQDQGLKVGSSAPELKIGKWVQGEVTSLSDPNKTYVVEFWATWCAPCMRSIPHLNKLYQELRYSGLEIMGISDEPFNTVKNFVAKKGGQMSYPVACDTEDKSANASWMKAANQNGIPCAFIVRGGKVLWIGNPLDPQFDLVLPVAIMGRYDPALISRAKPLFDAAQEAIKVKNYRDAYRHYDSVLALDGQVFGSIAVRKYKSLVVDAKDPAGARAWGDEMLKKYATDRYTLLELATAIMFSDEIKDRDYDLASRVVDAFAVSAPKGDVSGLRMRAAMYAAKNDFAQAQEVQYEAWMAAPPEWKGEYKKILEDYRKSAKNKPAKAAASSEAPAAPKTE